MGEKNRRFKLTFFKILKANEKTYLSNSQKNF